MLLWRAVILKDRGIRACTAKRFKNVSSLGRWREWVGTVFLGLRQKECSLGPFYFHLIRRNHPMFLASVPSLRKGLGAALVYRGTAEEAEAGTPLLQEASHKEHRSNTCRRTSHLKLSLPPYLKQHWELRPWTNIETKLSQDHPADGEDIVNILNQRPESCPWSRKFPGTTLCYNGRLAG